MTFHKNKKGYTSCTCVPSSHIFYSVSSDASSSGALVEKVEIDVGDMKLGDSLQVKDLDIAKKKDIDLITNPETTVVAVTEIHNSAPEDEASEETE